MVDETNPTLAAPDKKKPKRRILLAVVVAAGVVGYLIEHLTRGTSPLSLGPRAPWTSSQVQAQDARDSWSQGKDVELTLAHSRSANGQIVVRGTTNLPAGTIIVIALDPEKAGQNTAETKVNVTSEGTFVSELLGPASGVAPGRYVISATTPIARMQPGIVTTLIGERGEHLRGPLVSVLPHVGRTAGARREIIIPAN